MYYKTSKLIEDLRKEISQIVPDNMILNGFKVKMFRNGYLPDTKLSLLLCDYTERIKRIKRNIRANQEFKLALDELSEWETRIKHLFCSKGEKAIHCIEEYSKVNKNLPISRKKNLKTLNYHPKLKLDYFEKIDTKEKAYWLGFLWAEVYLGKRGEIKLELNKKDEVLINRFCKAIDLNLKYKKYLKKQRKNGIQIYVKISFRNSKIQDDLYKLGYVKSKMRSTIFPDLDNRELDLSFLLGFFDGDGKEGKNVLHIGSKTILEEIKEKFDIPHDILIDKRGYYHLSLGGKLFNSMMQNYTNSLERKRRFFKVSIKKN